MRRIFAKRFFVRRRTDDRGATLVEFAFVFPIMGLLMLGMADIGLVVVGNSVGSAAARDGARVGIIDYVCADQYTTGGTAASSNAGCSGTSTQYTAIRTAALKRLAGLVRGTPLIDVQCLNAQTLAHTECDDAPAITIGRDLIEVKITWNHVGASPFVANTTHVDKARMVITGKPDLTGSPGPGTYSYTCTEPDATDSTYVRVNGGTTDPSVTSATFTLMSTGQPNVTTATTPGADGTVTAWAPWSSLAADRDYTYTVTFTPAGVTATDPVCAFHTPASTGTPNFLVELETAGTKTAGTAFNVRITARIGTATDTSYTGSHTLAFSGPGTSPSGATPTYPGPLNFIGGVVTTSVTLPKAETATLTATEASRTGSTSVTVTGAAPVGIAFDASQTPSASQNCTSGSFIYSGNNLSWDPFIVVVDTYKNVTQNNATARTITVTVTGHSLAGGSSPQMIVANASPGRTPARIVVNLQNGSNKSGDVTVSATGWTDIKCTVKS